MQEVKVDLNLKTLADESDRQVKAIQQTHAKRDETSKCSKLIHSHGGEDFVWEQLTQGVTTTSLCQLLGVSISAFNRWVDRGGEARRSAYTRARAEAAHALADQTLAIADDSQYAETSTQVQAAKLRTDVRMRLASVWNKAEYGQQQAQVQVNIGDLALDALRKRTVIVDADDVSDNDR